MAERRIVSAIWILCGKRGGQLQGTRLIFFWGLVFARYRLVITISKQYTGVLHRAINGANEEEGKNQELTNQLLRALILNRSPSTPLLH